MRKLRWKIVAALLLQLLVASMVWAGDTDVTQSEATAQEDEKEAVNLSDITVSAPRPKTVMEITPEKTTFDLEFYESPKSIRSIVDIFKDSAAVDFRGASNIDVRSERGESPVYLRGFDVRRFVNAIDGVPFDQPLTFGQVIDYAQVPIGQVDEIEVIPGTHSARYWGKSVGGVINIKTKAPERKESAKPDLMAAYDYGSYHTINSRAALDGGYDGVNYAVSAQKTSTDGYLRHGKSETENYAWSLGYAFASGGFVKYMGTYAETDTEAFAINDPASDYDSDYPVVDASTGASKYSIDSQTHYRTIAHRVSYQQPTPIGKLDAAVSYTYRPDHYFTQYNNNVYVKNPNSEGKQIGVLVQDEIELFDGNTLAVGLDSQDFYTDFEPYGMDEIHVRDNKSGFLEDTWRLTPRLTLRGGLRYETVELNINNYSEVSGWGSVKGYQVTLDPPQKTIDREFNQLLPKFFMTYRLDEIASYLRDTSVSAGLSKLWNVAPYCLG